jgi:large subunit ribosomal protein L6
MSRIGNAPILIPSGITVEKTEGKVVVNGPKGQLELTFSPEITVEVLQDQVLLKRKNEQKKVKALHGLYRSLIANMVKGVNEGWSKGLELVGVGYRAQSSGDKLTLVVGFSHPVEISAPVGITFEVRDNTKVFVTGIDKHLVGQVSASIRAIKPPEPYQGKGIRYAGEYIRRKAGKAGKAGAAGAGK